MILLGHDEAVANWLEVRKQDTRTVERSEGVKESAPGGPAKEASERAAVSH